jgi:magnesium-transporting ATPase (P-type)
LADRLRYVAFRRRHVCDVLLGACADLPIEEARTIVVNTLVVLEIFYLFSVRYVGSSSITWEGVVGTRAVLIGVGLVTAAQIAFTYTPFMQTLFATRPVGLLDGLAIIGLGIFLLLLLEAEKAIRRHFIRVPRPTAKN